MEPFTNFFLEKELGKMNIEVERNITATYLLFEKGKAEKKLLKNANRYIKYALGADGTESVAHSKEMCEKGFDGIIHIKPFGCTPEINAIPILQKISKDYNVPIIYFTFDMQTSETGVRTRLEAFYDMLIMKKEAKNA
jgi:predicted nucleotide-binding protein (sugar kinase/HSP70/actin superfamily)